MSGMRMFKGLSGKFLPGQVILLVLVRGSSPVSMGRFIMKLSCNQM